MGLEANKQAVELTDEGFMTIPEVADFLGRSSIYALLASGELPSAKFRGARRVPTKALRDYAAARLAASAQEGAARG